MTIEINRLSHEGRGIASVDGKTTFVFGALPNEQVSLTYIRKKSSFDEAIVDQILAPSPQRVTPECKFFGMCGGCSLQHLEQIAQIDFKQNVLLEQLWHFGKVKPESILKPLSTHAYGYRRKARYSVRYVAKKGKVLIGFRELTHPRFLADIDSCKVLHPAIGNLIIPLQDCLSTLDQKDQIAQVEAAVGDNATALVIRHLQKISESDYAKLVSFGEEHGIWIYLQPSNYASIHKITPINSADYLTYGITNSLTLHFHPCDFTQINADINRAMIQQALGLLDLKTSDVVTDLFCGIGNFTLPIAQQCSTVLGIEGEQLLINRARMNAERNNISNASFICADLHHIPELPANCNKLLIDPPRSGARAIVEQLALDNIETIVYVSCNPSTLARDAGILSTRGFKLAAAGVMDMFTHTEHIEAMACFKKSDACDSPQLDRGVHEFQ